MRWLHGSWADARYFSIWGGGGGRDRGTLKRKMRIYVVFSCMEAIKISWSFVIFITEIERVFIMILALIRHQIQGALLQPPPRVISHKGLSLPQTIPHPHSLLTNYTGATFGFNDPQLWRELWTIYWATWSEQLSIRKPTAPYVSAPS